MHPCGDTIKFPGVISIVHDDHDGHIIARWKADPDSDYRVERPHPLLCLVLITRLGYRVRSSDPTPAA